MAYAGVADALDLHCRVRVNFTRPLDRFRLCWLVATNSFGARPSDCVVALIFSPFDK
jgi:hypothetical protein